MQSATIMFYLKKQHILCVMLLSLTLVGIWLTLTSGGFVLIEQLPGGTTAKQFYSLKYDGAIGYLLAQNNKVVKDLRLEVRREKPSMLDIRIVDVAGKHYQIPMDEEPFKTVYRDINEPEPLDESLYAYAVTVNNNPLKVTVKRKSTDEVIFTIDALEFSQYYIAFETNVCSRNFFGLGERNQRGFRFREGQYTLMARDEPKLLEDGKRPGKHVYSSQPVYLMREKSKNYHLVFYKSASPMDVDYHGDKMKFITIGGVVHLKFFLGDKEPETAVKLYHEYLGGGWAVPPFWSTGFHQSRWTYKTANMLIDVIRRHMDNHIPLDVIWSDLDYMFDRQIFSVNKDFGPTQYQIIKKELGIRYVPLLDVAVGVKYGKNDHGYSEGINYDIFLRSSDTGRRFQGYVWPGDSYFPDFFHPNITTYWTSMLDHLHNSVPFDGIWADMNEPTNFCDGECNWSRMVEDDDRLESAISPHIEFPYLPGGVRLESKTISPNIKHSNGALHVDVHNIYGFMNTWVTHQAQKSLGAIQTFQLTRSTFPGSGVFTQHWFGDNAATWDFLYLSVGQIFQFNIFGMPMVGADVCGFMDTTEEKLCARWIQVAALQPFMRNHNNDMARPQEFYALGSTVLRTAQRNVKLRYSLLKWYYMLYFRGEMTGTIYRPLFFEFPDDQAVFNDDVLDTQIMIGQELMSSPIMERNVVIRKAHFPLDTWYDFLTGLLIQKLSDPPRYHMVYSPLDDFVPLYIRGGSIVLTQDVKYVQTTRDLGQKYTAVVALDLDDKGILEQVATGNFLDLHDFLDEREVVDSCEKASCMLSLQLEVDEQIEFSILDHQGAAPKHPIKLTEIVVYGLTHSNDTATCEDQLGNNVKCTLRATNYFYVTDILFEKELLFGGSGGIKSVRIKW